MAGEASGGTVAVAGGSAVEAIEEGNQMNGVYMYHVMSWHKLPGGLKAHTSIILQNNGAEIVRLMYKGRYCSMSCHFAHNTQFSCTHDPFYFH